MFSFLFFFCLLKSYMVLCCFILKRIIISQFIALFCGTLHFYIFDQKFCSSWVKSDNSSHSSYFLLDMYANTSNLIHMCMCTWVHNERKQVECCQLGRFFVLFTFKVINFTAILLI